MSDLNDIDARLKTVETTLVSWGNKVEEGFHRLFDPVEKAATAVTLMQEAREKGTDWIARAIALAALAVALFAAMYLCWHPGVISQEANPSIHVDSKPSEAELHDRRVRDQLNHILENSDATERPELLPGPVGDDPSPASGTE